LARIIAHLHYGTIDPGITRFTHAFPVKAHPVVGALVGAFSKPNVQLFFSSHVLFKLSIQFRIVWCTAIQATVTGTAPTQTTFAQTVFAASRRARHGCATIVANHAGFTNAFAVVAQATGRTIVRATFGAVFRTPLARPGRVTKATTNLTGTVPGTFVGAHVGAKTAGIPFETLDAGTLAIQTNAARIAIVFAGQCGIAIGTTVGWFAVTHAVRTSTVARTIVGAFGFFFTRFAVKTRHAKTFVVQTFPVARARDTLRFGAFVIHAVLTIGTPKTRIAKTFAKLTSTSIVAASLTFCFDEGFVHGRAVVRTVPNFTHAFVQKTHPVPGTFVFASGMLLAFIARPSSGTKTFGVVALAMPIATVFTRQFLIALTLVGFPSSIAITLAKVACTMTVQREKGKGKEERKGGKERTGKGKKNR